MSDYATLLDSYNEALRYIELLESQIPGVQPTRPEGMPSAKPTATAATTPKPAAAASAPVATSKK